jgi:hypothetical protein
MTYQPPQGPYPQQDPYRPQEWPQQLTGQQPPGWPGQPQPGQPPGDHEQDPGAPRHPHAQPAKPHRVRTILLGSAAGVVLLLIGVAIGSAGAKTSKPAPAPTVTVTAQAAAAPTVTITRRAHAAPAVTVTVTATAAAAAAAAPNPAPASHPAAASDVLITFSGSGIRNSAPFVVNSSSVTTHYSYSCSAFGSSGNFIADMVSGSPSSGSYDDQSIANELGTGGSQTTTIYPQDVGSTYHLEVDSECSWSITLTAG